MTPDSVMSGEAGMPGLHPISTLEVEADGDDLEGLVTLLQGAAVIGIGEPTHGTAECYKLRQRIIQELVIHCGCRQIGLEAGWAEARSLNRYLVDGSGDAASAVAALGFWMWDVWEFRALVDWLRDFNTERDKLDRVRVFGVDGPKGSGPTELLRSLLVHAPALLTPGVLALLEDCRLMVPWEAPADDPSGRFVTDGLERLAEDLRASVDLDDDARALALTAVDILQTIDRRRRADDNRTNWNLRDEAMGNAVLREIESRGTTGPVVLLAHNAHVGKDAKGLFSADLRSMGMHLAEHLGHRYVSVGQMFGEGAFQALVDDGTGMYRLSEVTVGPPPEGYLDWHLLHSTDAPAAWIETKVISLHPDDKGMVLIREAGADFTTEADMAVAIEVAAQHDVVLFIPTTTRAHPTPTGERSIRG